MLFMICWSSGAGLWNCVTGTLALLDSLVGAVGSLLSAAFRLRCCTIDALGVFTAFGGVRGFTLGGGLAAGAATVFASAEAVSFAGGAEGVGEVAGDALLAVGLAAAAAFGGDAAAGCEGRTLKRQQNV